MTEENITMNDCRRAGHCPRGVKRWFAAQNLDFRHFLLHGIPPEDMWRTGDAQGQQVVTRTRASRETNDG